jgi:hypothetical protein
MTIMKARANLPDTSPPVPPSGRSDFETEGKTIMEDLKAILKEESSLLEAYRSLKNGNVALSGNDVRDLYAKTFHLAVPPHDGRQAGFERVTIVDPNIRTVMGTATMAV